MVKIRTLYYNGIIRTMGETPLVEAVLTNGEIIESTGDYDKLKRIAQEAEQINLDGKTMLPAFIDTHSHLSSYAMSFLQVPLEECSNFDEIKQRIENFIQINEIKPGKWITAKGYDHNSLSEKRHPSLAVVDAAAPDNPLVLQHASGHVGVFNSEAMKILGVTAETPSPEGGKIGLSDGKLTGYFEENAFITYLKQVPMQSMDSIIEGYSRAQKKYASHGISTIQEGMTVEQMLPLYQLLVEQSLFNLDVVAYLMPQDAKLFLSKYPQAINTYLNHFKIGGYKIVLDGSPQGRTAWMRTPYLDQEPAYYGYGTMSDEAVVSAVRLAAAEQTQLLAHCNGDAAAKQYLNAIAHVLSETGCKPVRPVMIHAQLLGKDQLAKVKRLGVMPSFFVAHVYHWGDIHIKNFGMSRASSITPAKSALHHNIMFTFHQDTPVIEPNMLETVWCAVNRITKGGITLGEKEKISVIDALKAITINAAIQYGEEREKGSIEKGKKADFVILDKDPVTIEPMKIREVKVIQTIKNAKTIFADR